MKYDAVIFDLFGTLVDNPTSPGVKRLRYEQLMSKVAVVVSIPTDDFLQAWAETAPRRGTGYFPTTEANIAFICQELGRPIEAGKVAEAARMRFEFWRAALMPRKDSLATLAQLKASGYKIGLISNCSQEPPSLWSDTPFPPSLDTAVFSSVVGLSKPDPRIYNLACTQLGVTPDRCLYVGDGESDELAGAARVGMYPIRIRVPYEQRPDDAAHRWDGPEISALAQVLTHLK